MSWEEWEDNRDAMDLGDGTYLVLARPDDDDWSWGIWLEVMDDDGDPTDEFDNLVEGDILSDDLTVARVEAIASCQDWFKDRLLALKQ